LTAKDVARKSGVSTATVSRVVNNDSRISPETTKRVKKAIEELGYTPNHFARGLKTSRSFTVGFIAPEFTNDFFMGIAQSVENRLRKEGFSLIICNSSESSGEEASRLRLLLDRGVDGVIVIPAGSAGGHFEAAAERGVPLVLVDRLVEGFSTDAVLVDNVNGTYQAMEIMIKEGNRRIGFIGGDPRLTSARERYDGYCRALDDYRIPLESALVRFGDFHAESGYKLMKELHAAEKRPTCVFVSNYFMHVGATRFLMEHGKPWTPSIISFDEMELSFTLAYCRMVVRQPISAIGAQAAEFLMSRISGDSEGAPRLARLKTEVITSVQSYNLDFAKDHPGGNK